MSAPPGSPPARVPGTSIERIVRCPACGGRSVFSPRNPHRPFCCAVCKGIDLGAWASEQYRMAADTPREDEGQA